MQWAPDTSDKWAPDPGARHEWALDAAAEPLTLGAAVEHFLTAKAAEGASPKTIEWYRMVLGRATRDLGARRSHDALTSAELRSWLLTLRATLSPISVAGYVRGLKAFGNWCAAEQLAEARSLRTLRRPQVPSKLVEPLTDEALRRLLDTASVRDRAIVLLMLDTGLRLSEVAGLRACDLRPDGSAKVLGPTPITAGSGFGEATPQMREGRASASWRQADSSAGRHHRRSTTGSPKSVASSRS